MESYEHLPLPIYRHDMPKIPPQGGGGFKIPEGRQKSEYYTSTRAQTTSISQSYNDIKARYRGMLNPNLIYRIKVNQGVDYDQFSRTLNGLGGLSVLSVAEDKKGYWVVFSQEDDFRSFNRKLEEYAGVRSGHKYDFFNVIDTIEDIPASEKMGQSLKESPLLPGEISYLNVELWRMEDDQLDQFLLGLRRLYSWNEQFKITDQLITNSFALLRVKLNLPILEDLLTFKEIALIDRPYIPTFSVTDFNSINIDEFSVIAPSNSATGILIVDSGITSSHPLIEKSLGDSENFQEIEKEANDLVGHGTSVAGTAIYGDIDSSISAKVFAASNWLFSAKVMYRSEYAPGQYHAVYDQEKLLENQLRNALSYFLNNESYRIKVVNLSLGNDNEVFTPRRTRQFTLAALIDDLAIDFPNVVFIVAAGNMHPANQFSTLDEISSLYPEYLLSNDSFRIVNPATSALALTVGSIAKDIRYVNTGISRLQEDIWCPIAQQNQPSPFTRTGFGINGMMKPDVVHYGGNLILREEHGEFGKIQEVS